MLMRKTLTPLLAALLALSWAGPLCAMPAPQADAHACCPADARPSAPATSEASCCLSTPALPPAPSAVPASVVVAHSEAPALVAVASVFTGLPVAASFVAPDAPPGASSGLSPPAAGL